MIWLNVVLLIYAALVLAGGLFGYFRAGSPVSAIASGAAALLVLVGVLLSGSNKNLGYGVAAFVALALVVFFLIRVLNGKFMPGIPALVLSAVALGCVVIGHFMRR
ncbi:MAG: TMEM14 family protein [Armatimonadetes bacterium]|nr:TMEM14 family protein [Armatimonadota bacterium]